MIFEDARTVQLIFLEYEISRRRMRTRPSLWHPQGGHNPAVIREQHRIPEVGTVAGCCDPQDAEPSSSPRLRISPPSYTPGTRRSHLLSAVDLDVVHSQEVQNRVRRGFALNCAAARLDNVSGGHTELREINQER